MTDTMTARGRERGQTTDDAECQDAMRLLLRHPLVTDTGPHAGGLATIRRHRERLGKDFRQLLGYRLAVEPGFARLYKAGLGPGTGRPLLRPSGAPFSPRAYAYLALACAVLLTSRRQTLLSSLADEVRLAGTEAGIEWGADSTSDRRAFVAALSQLIAWGVLEEDDGTVGAFADDATSEALLTVNRDIVRHLLAVPLREVETPGELVGLAADPGFAGARHRARRLLVEEPAVLADDVDDETWAWLRDYQRREAEIFAVEFGLELEIRAEGVAAIDPRDELTDFEFPRGGTLGHAALLTVGALVERLRPADLARDTIAASVPIPDGMLDDVVAGLLADRPTFWSKEYVDKPDRLPRDVEELLVAMRLIRRDGASLRLSAIASRYAPYLDVPPPAAAQPEVVP